ncbi:MAG: sodium:proton exchanger [Flavobacteriales bacterium TMED191]|nr:MAG: sodium:proton exchanger [Flavobacteriales bacterium TMED191]
MDPYILIISLSSIIIISHFLNIYSENTGVPSVLILILFGAILQLDTQIVGFQILDDTTRKPLLKVLGVAGLILILLEAALDLKINKNMIVSSLRAFFVGLFGLLCTSFAIAYILQVFVSDLDLLHALLYSVPLSIISSAIIIPSIQSLDESKRSFLIYESTFSDVLGLLMFQVILGSLATGAVKKSSEIVGNIGLSILISIIISIVLIYLFQKIKGHTKLFFLFSILLLLYALGEMLHLSSLLIVLIFGIILNNYQLVFVGFLSNLIDDEKVTSIQNYFKIIIMESAFVVRTFFFILFGYYVSLSSLLNFEVIIISLVLLAAIYFIRFVLIFPTMGGRSWPELFLSPRGLITILLFFSIPEEYVVNTVFHTEIIPGILLFIILGSALAMSNALIGVKKLEFEKKLAEIEDESKDAELDNIDPETDMLNDDYIGSDIKESETNDLLEEEQNNETDSNDLQSL